MARTWFGTDGVRGSANTELTPELVLALGRAVARTITATTFLIGRDTRKSGPMLQAALGAGLASEGADVVDVGVLPTPALAWLSVKRDLPAVVISASHNPFGDNGIKLFGAGGTKLAEELEQAIEDELHRVLDPTVKGPRPLEGHGVGTIRTEPDLGAAYVEYLAGTLDGRRLDGLRVVVDSANGSASELAAAVFEQLGAEVVAIGCDPDGTNINAGCGSTATGAAGPGRGRARGRTWAWPSTATPTGSWPWTRPARWSTATRCWPCSPGTWPTGASWPATPWW